MKVPHIGMVLGNYIEIPTKETKASTESCNYKPDRLPYFDYIIMMIKVFL